MFSHSDFPIFTNNPGLIYLDGASTTPKPSYIIDGVNHFLTHSYANIHRGQYGLALESERLYWDCKEKVAKWINANVEEVIFTSNSSDASNMLVEIIRKNHLIQAGEVILLSVAEHHANIVPRQMLCEELWCRIDWIGLDTDYDLDMQDFWKKYTSEVKIVALSTVSNVTGTIYDLKAIKELLREDTLFIVDASQSISHMELDVQALGCDFCYFTGHKLYAYTGIWVLYGKKSLLKSLKPTRWWGGMIDEVTMEGYSLQGLPDRREVGTPNLVWVVSLLKALEYIEQNGWYDAMHVIEYPLVVYICDFFANNTNISLIGSLDPSKRVGVFSFTIEGQSMTALAQKLAQENICVRAGGQCAHPLHQYLQIEGGTCRVSVGVWNTVEEVERVCEEISKFCFPDINH
jgi:cysteine desulfurase / selenocysteine lyase